MFNTVKNKLSTGVTNEKKGNNTKTNAVDSSIIKELAAIIGKDIVGYLNLYPTYHDHLKQLHTLNKMLISNRKYNLAGNLILVEVEPNNENHAYDKFMKGVFSLFNNYAEKPLDATYSIDMHRIFKDKRDFIYGSKNEALINDVRKSFLIVENAAPYLKDDNPDFKGCLDLLTDMKTVGTVICRGTKAELQTILRQMSNPSHFYFNFNTEYSFEEFATVIELIFQKRNIVMDNNWKDTLRSFFSQPTEANKRKDYKYLRNFVEDMQKTVLGDSNQVQRDGKFLLKNEYFRVHDSSTSFRDLESLKELDKLIGMEEAKQSVNELIAYLEFNQKLQEKIGKSYPLNLHMMFTGTPGTGKTTIARIIGKVLFELGYITKEEIVEVDKKDLVSQWVGHTAIKTNEIIQQARGGVLFIDEAYAVADDKFGKDAIATLIKAMADLKTELVVIVAGYKKEMQDFVNSNPGIASRIGRKIHFDDYSAEELIQMYDKKLEEFSMTSTTELREELVGIINHFKGVENFGNGRFVDNIIQDILFTYAVNTEGIPVEDMDFTLTVDDIPAKYYDVVEV